ncbi:MAG TPA: phage tail tip lysozyme, partial [Polyangia bacterium]
MALAAGGCVGAPAVEGESSEALTTAFANDKPAFDFFVAKGLTNFQAAGIVGNLDQESGVDPASVQFGGGPGRGIAQWSVGGRWDTSTNDNVLGYASKLGQSSGSLNLQLEFIWYELTTFGYGFSELKATTNVTDATVVFMDKYEICGTCAQAQRVSYAQSVLNAYGAAPPYAATFVSQTWPYASAPPFTVKCGESVAAKIVLKNTGTKSWDGSTKLGTTMARDRASIFAGSNWLAPNRAAAIVGSVAPGADGTFAFAFDGPTGAACVPGTYHEFFGVVQEGVAWFSDNG